MSSITLIDIAKTIDMLDVHCTRCERKGRRSVERLIDQHGGNTKLPDLRRHLVGDCDKVNGMDFEWCDILLPQLVFSRRNGLVIDNKRDESPSYAAFRRRMSVQA